MHGRSKAILAVLFYVALTWGPAGRAIGSGPVTLDIFVSGREGYATYRIPAIVSTGDGALLAFCEGRRWGPADHGNIDIVLKRSRDNGRTWSPLQVVHSQGWNTVGNPAPVVDRHTGTVWLPFCVNNDKVFLTKSDDGGESWSEPREITADVKRPGWTWYATGPGHSIQLSSGRLLVPCDHHDLGINHSHVIYSDDHGATWSIGGVLPAGTDECMAAETESGILLAMRDIWPGAYRAFSESFDGGMTWTQPVIYKDVPGPTCQASIVRLSAREEDGGRILFMNPASDKREKLTLRLSRDDGMTWSESRILHPGKAAYSDMAVLPDKRIAALYENGDRFFWERITFALIEPEWVEE